jgi:hypothetical protein
MRISLGSKAERWLGGGAVEDLDLVDLVMV